MSGIGAKILGALTGGLGDRIGGIVDKLVPDKDLATNLKHELDITKLAGDIDLAKIEIEADRDIQVAIEQTHQAALNQSDLYTKRTRPKIARQSWFLGSAYAVITIVAGIVDPFTEADLSTMAFDAYIFGTLVGPALWYSGMRGFDKWKGRT